MCARFFSVRTTESMYPRNIDYSALSYLRGSFALFGVSRIVAERETRIGRAIRGMYPVTPSLY